MKQNCDIATKEGERHLRFSFLFSLCDLSEWLEECGVGLQRYT